MSAINVCNISKDAKPVTLFLHVSEFCIIQFNHRVQAVCSVLHQRRHWTCTLINGDRRDFPPSTNTCTVDFCTNEKFGEPLTFCFSACCHCFIFYKAFLEWWTQTKCKMAPFLCLPMVFGRHCGCRMEYFQHSYVPQWSCGYMGVFVASWPWFERETPFKNHGRTFLLLPPEWTASSSAWPSAWTTSMRFC